MIRTVVGLAVLTVGAAAAIATAAAYEPPAPEGCPSLVAQSERTHDVAIEMIEAGCEEDTAHDPTARS